MSVSIGKLFNIGCGDNSCWWGARGGMATNGGCRCYERARHESAQSLQTRMELNGGIRLLRQLAELPEIKAALIELVKITKEQSESITND